ncbi:VOC family protein [Candidatus Roizmanbacteria bacterium]|nr:MAG: VOC family protein [Candidatus Roizmanbacteria bacterium]
MKKNPVVHFEMPAKDRARVSKFYSEAFGWGMQQLGPEMGDYVMAATSEVGENGMPSAPGTINGGFFDYKDDELNRAPHVVISVENIEESIEAVKAAGGEIKTEIMDIPGVGKYVSFLDTEGNVVGILQPSQGM